MTDFAGSDFTSGFWHYYIAAFTFFGILFCLWLLKSQTTKKLAEGEEAELMAPTWDGDLQELNNPLPRWWMWMFYGLTLFGIVYLVLYPGFGKFAGVLGWSSFQEWKDDKDKVDAEFEKVMAPFKSRDVMAVAADPKAREMGQNLFLTYCSQCHGSAGQGGKGFPDLTDKLWLFGGTPDDIRASITDGRTLEMPGGMAGDEASAREIANYVLAMGGKQHDAALAAAGKEKYAVCAACHGEDGKGNSAAGFPNIVDDAWQYGGSEGAIIESIVKGRKGGMPAQTHLGEAKLHLLTAYVWGLGGGQKPVVEEAAPQASGDTETQAATN
ncbi:MAG TPA: cytochrome-c oxidase, cbb3-type subunit III [Thiobacillaceae bacterium]|nr:cytochrome-c oxidase, cbb3-type subunit III [Thiobacillaceae bacterium]HNU64020.1 cytochrome-c oxidase, cbb3-type subunit III [Thiobacillaceae bacterium]